MMKRARVVLQFFLLCLLTWPFAFTSSIQAQTSGQSSSVGTPELPRQLMNTDFVPPTGRTISVKAGDNLQLALNTAQPGDTLRLEAGAEFRGPFTLPSKSGNNWIVIRSSAANLPSDGTRIQSSDAPLLPKLVAPGANEVALRTEPGAHHYRFIGIEFKKSSAEAVTGALIALGDGSRAQTSLDQVPHHLIFDRVYVHGEKTGGVIHCLVLASAWTAVINSHVSECTAVGADAQAIVGWNGPGPFKIVNNYLEASGENVMFGGAAAANESLLPSDIEFRRNHLYKPLSWRIGDPSYQGIPWSVKNLFELKIGRRILIEGNVFENSWAHAQVGFAFMLTPRTEVGKMPWAQISDVTIRNNIIRHAANGVAISGHDSRPNPGQPTARIAVYNNLFDDIDGPKWGLLGSAGVLFQMSNGPADVVIEHNTALHAGTILAGEAEPQTGFVFRNNIVLHNAYGVHNISGGANSKFPDWVFKGNVIIGIPPSLIKQYPANNFFPATVGEVQFANAAEGNYRLASTSPYKRAGTGGQDIGADPDAIETAVGKAAAKISSAGKGAS